MSMTFATALQLGGGIAAFVGGIIQLVEASLSEKDAEKVGDIVGYIDELERINTGYAEQARKVKTPAGAMVEGMLISEIDEIMAAAEAPARAANLKVKKGVVQAQAENAKRRKPYRVVAMVLVVAGSIVALIGTGIAT